MKRSLIWTKLYTLFERESEWQKTEQVPNPLSRYSRNFFDVKTWNKNVKYANGSITKSVYSFKIHSCKNHCVCVCAISITIADICAICHQCTTLWYLNYDNSVFSRIFWFKQAQGFRYELLSIISIAYSSLWNRRSPWNNRSLRKFHITILILFTSI